MGQMSLKFIRLHLSIRKRYCLCDILGVHIIPLPRLKSINFSKNVDTP